VNDLQNHIHQAIKDIHSGILPVTEPTANVEVVSENDAASAGIPAVTELHGNSSLWQHPTLAPNTPHPETVTVTLTQNPGEDGYHIISRVETHLSDGTTQISTSLTPETAQMLAKLTPETASLLSKLHPNMFPEGTYLQSEAELNASHTAASMVLTQPSNVLTSGSDPTMDQSNVTTVSMTSEGTLTAIKSENSLGDDDLSLNDTDHDVQIGHPGLDSSQDEHLPEETPMETEDQLMAIAMESG